MSKENKEIRVILPNGNSITVDESIARDLYLAQFYSNKQPILGPLTGDPYKDKPWTKQYLDGPYADIKDYNVFSPLHVNYFNACKDNLDDIALYTDRGNYTNRELKEMSLKVATGLQSIKDRPKIAVFVNNSIEEPAILLAASMCGAIVYFVDITKSPDDMKRSVEEFNPDIMLMDEVIMPLVPYLNTKQVPVVVANTDKEYNNQDTFSFEEVMKKGENKELKPIDDFDPMAPFLVITSSGTTGRPKPIVHSSYSVNQASLKVLYTNYSLSRDNVMMKVIPAHIGLGIITTLYTSLISGTKLSFVAGNGPEDSVIKSMEFVINYPKFKEKNGIGDNAKLLMFAAPMFYRALYSQLDNIEDLSYMGCMLAAGSKMGQEELDMLNEAFAKKRCYIPICNGYGSNENAGAVTLNSNTYNMNGSAGFPIIGTDVLVVNDNNEPVINQEGRVIVRSDSQFLHYLGMEEATKKARINLFGTCWVEMNDIGMMTDKGFLFITGRISRVITKYDCKVSIDTVEEKLRMHPAINDCGVVALENASVDVAYAFVTIDGDYEYKKLINDISNTPGWLSNLEKPDYVIVLDKMPIMNNGKIDFIKLKELAQEDYKKLGEGINKLEKKI